jgi:hypothetical protein
MFDGHTDPAPKKQKQFKVFYLSFAKQTILLVGKKYRTVATQGFFGKAELPTL